MSRFTDWSHKAITNPTIWTEPKPTIRITVRLIAGMFGQHVVEIELGDPHASTALNRTSIRFPDPFDDEGHPTSACRAFVVETIRNAVQHDRHQRWITWPNGTATAFTRDDVTPVPLSSPRPSDRHHPDRRRHQTSSR